jgi:hypothetical protein
MTAPAGHVRRDPPLRPSVALTLAFGALASGLVLARLYKFRPFLDEPHAFRQAWTAGYSREFYAFDMNIFRPSIVSMGDYRHVVIEFPLPEWIAAAVYHVTGPTLLVDRALSVLFFVASAYFLFRAIELVQDSLMSWLTTLVYMAAPLGIYYSRAVHIDAAALAFGNGLLFYFLRYGKTGRARDLACAFVASAFGLLVKAPYVFFLILPVLYVLLARGRRSRTRTAAAVFAAALAVGLGWYFYAQAVNSGAPDLSFIRGYESTANRLDFYLGDAGRRLNLREWSTLFGRVNREIAVGIWWVLLPLAIVQRRRFRELWNFASVWTMAALVYVVMFFAANSMHHYYQLPLVAPFAVWAAMGLYGLVTAQRRAVALRQAAAFVVVAAYAVSGTWFAFHNYYAIDELGMRVGRYVNARTADRDLVIMAFNDAQFFDPRYLYYAGRRGWTIHASWLEPEDIEKLRPYGATTIVTSDRWKAPSPTVEYLEKQELTGVLTLTDLRIFVHRLR